MNNERYPHVFSEFKLGPAVLPNRIVFPAWQLNYANTDGTVSEKLMKFYTDLARGGCGLIMTGCATVTPEGIPFDRVMHGYDDKFIPGMRELFAALKKEGAVAGLQLVHYGRQSSTSISGDVLMAPSAIPCPAMSQYDPEYKVREMTLEDIAHVRNGFIDTAERAVKAGCQLVEVHACHGYLGSQFMSPYSNKRTDDYGGTVENRCRFIVEIVEGIRQRVGDKLAICVRVNGNDFVEGGLIPEDYKEIAPILEKAGTDLLHVSAGVYESMDRIVPPKNYGTTPHVHLAAEVKRFASVPVCGVGSIISHGLEAAEGILADGKADLCAMGRAQMADPYLVKKSLEGNEDDINACIHCNSCTFWTTGDPNVFCATNPDYQKPK